MQRLSGSVRLLWVLVLSALALSGQPSAVRADALALPPALRSWLGNEQGRIDRSVDTTRLMALTNTQDPRFSPEQGKTFSVKSYWVDASLMHSFRGEGIDARVQSLFERTVGGKRQVRLLVHPESEKLYECLVKRAGVTRAEDFKASATASSRTLVAWLPGREKDAVFAKVSLDKMIGGVRRTVSQGEVARSVGINNILHSAKAAGELPSSFKFVPEVFSAIPRGMSEGGMVIRQIPREVVDGRRRYVPLFALYAQPKNGSEPLLLELIRKSGLSAERFVRDALIRPFAKQWLSLAVLHGIAPQPHAQNMLIELDARGRPTGHLVHRDFGGFDVDFKLRSERGLAMPKTSLPQISASLAKDYKADRFGGGKRMMRKVNTFFYGGFVYNLDQSLPRWAASGKLGAGAEAIAPHTFRAMLASELGQAYHGVTGRSLTIKSDLSNVKKLLRARKLVVSPRQAQLQRTRSREQPRPRRWWHWGRR